MLRRWIKLSDQFLPPDILEALATLLDVPEDLVVAVWEQTRVHGEYRTFQIRLDRPRELNVPSEPLRQLQLRALSRILYTGPVSPAAYAGVPGRSVVNAARRHLDREAGHVMSFDISDAYGNTTYSQVLTALKRRLGRDLWVLGLSGEEAQQVLAVLGYFLTCRRPIGAGRKLPLGAATSVALFNLVCLELDGELFRLLLEDQNQRLAPLFTRYVDDMVFSASAEFPPAFAAQVAAVVKGNGFRLNDDKTRSAPLGQARVYGLVKENGTVVPGREARERLARRIAEHRAVANNEGAAPNRRLRSRAALRAIDGYLRQFYDVAGVERPEPLRFEAPSAELQTLSHLDLLWG